MTHVLSLARRLPKERIQPLVVFFLDGPSVREAQKMGLNTKVLPWRLPLDYTLMWRLREMIHRERIDIIHTHTITGNFYARMAALLSRKPINLVTTVHSWLLDELQGPPWVRLRNYLRFKRELLLSERVTQYISVSNSLKEKMCEFGIPEEKTEVIENGIELPDLSTMDAHNRSVREEFRIRNGETIVATIGRMVPVKNQDLFLQAAKRVLEKTRHVRFLLVGDGPLLDQLRRRAKDLAVSDHTVFTGWRGDVHRILCAVDIFVLCSRVEGLNISVLEAMAHAKPVIGTNVRGICDIVSDNETGILVPPHNVEVLADSIVKLVEEGPVARTMGLKARQRVENEYSVQEMVSKVVGLYERLCPE